MPERKRIRDEELQAWGDEHRIDVERLDEGQKWVVLLALRILAVVGDVKPFRRIVGYFLVHCGFDLGSTLIGALVGTSDRNVRYHRGRTAGEFWKSVSSSVRGHPAPKLGPEQVGPIAKYLVEHPGARVKEILQFIRESFAVEIDRLTLRRYIKRYGLGCLQGDRHKNAPLF